jgi:catechol 2,3-dioxygenase-like lactoylglutathione lyase family enzyme
MLPTTKLTPPHFHRHLGDVSPRSAARAMARRLIQLIAALAASSVTAFQLPRTLAPTRHRARTHAPVASAVSLLRVAHRVSDLAAVSAFYSETLGLATLEEGSCADGRARRLLGSTAAALQLELRQSDGPAGFSQDGAYRGLSARVPDVAAAADAAASFGGSVLVAPSLVLYGPSLVPEEEDQVLTNVTQALVADPAGFPLLLFQDEACAGKGELCAARLDVTAWKPSQDWWAGRGLATLRWQSNLPREASIVVTVGPPGKEAGPCGVIGEGCAVLQLRYVFSAPDVVQAGGLEAIVLSGGADIEGEPNGYPLVVEG